MTDKFATQTLTELAKAGVLFLVMGVALYALWSKMERNDEQQRLEIMQLRKETAECRSEQLKITLDQISRNTEVIQRNTDVMTNLINRR